MSAGRGEQHQVEELESEEGEEDADEAHSDVDEGEEDEAGEWSPRRTAPSRIDPQEEPLVDLLSSSRSPEEESSVHWGFMLVFIVGACVFLDFLYVSLMWGVMTY